MSQALYERYKDALRRGHVAALRERLDTAEAAYRSAAAIAPDRALPYTSLAGVLRRQGRADEALAAYTAALARAPEDEGALRGRAELHVDAGRRAEAAHDFEMLASVLERGGQLAEAGDAARRALELAESRSRRREVGRLEALVREGAEDRSAVDALDRTLQVLDPADVAVSRPGVTAGQLYEAPAGGSPAGEAARAEGSGPSSVGGEPGQPTESTSGTSAVSATAAEATDGADRASADLATDDERGSEATPPRHPDPAVLRAVADALLDSGDLAGAGQRFLALAELHRSAGRHDAAMDACLALLAATPSDHRLQLSIASIQLDRGWVGTAAEKLRLLARLADLDGDSTARESIAALARDRGLEPSGPPAARA